MFAALPNHSESICWVSGRTDLLAALLALLSTTAYLRRMRTPAVLLWAAGLLAKESILPLPLLWLPLNPDRPRSKSWTAFLALLPFVYPVVRIVLDPHYLETVSVLVAQVGFRPGDLFENLFRFLFRVFLPPLPDSMETVLRERSMIIAAIVLVLWSVVVMAAIRQAGKDGAKLVFTLTAAFLVSLLPAIRMKVSLFDTQLERLLFFPGIIACMLLAFIVRTICGSGLRLKVIMAGIVFSMSIYSLIAVRNWQYAGDLCDDLSSDVQRFQNIDILVLNIPDNLNGAYVFRNGFIEAIRMSMSYTPCSINIYVLSTHSISSTTDSISLAVSESLTTIFLPLGEEFCSIDSLTIPVAAQGRKLQIAKPVGFDQLLYYSNGSLLEVY